ncbi:MAG TPA: carbon-nitrogen hydrolase family protein [Candidatus Yaniella excrementigallinarum]|nr:carbon-nitrogen hydrolase family protein [Candidatus Yaniella excrementigallinarum]
MSLHVAVVQYAPTTDKAENIATIQKLVSSAADQGAQLAVLPEYATFTNRVFDRTFVDNAEELDGESVTALRKLSAAKNIALIAGVNEPAGAGKIFNTLVGIHNGEIVATYRKVHLYDAFGNQESQWVTPGEIEPPELLELNGLKIGMQTCYDLRFPEVSRVLIDAGADVLALPAEWVPGPLKEFHWTALLQARAIENTAYVVAAGQNAPTGVGRSAIIDPMGIAVATIGEETGIAQAQLHPERIDSVRSTNPALAMRRFSVSPHQ